MKKLKVLGIVGALVSLQGCASSRPIYSIPIAQGATSVDTPVGRFSYTERVETDEKWAAELEKHELTKGFGADFAITEIIYSNTTTKTFGELTLRVDVCRSGEWMERREVTLPGPVQPRSTRTIKISSLIAANADTIECSVLKLSETGSPKAAP